MPNPTVGLGVGYAGITGCFVSLGYTNQTTGKDTTGSYIITIQEDFSEIVLDSQTGYTEMEYYCSYKS